jgi:UDPglucose 6-dehydrogenase
MKVGIVGHGTVGRYLAEIFTGVPLEVAIYDKFKQPYCNHSDRNNVNSCDLAFVAVPTPTTGTGCCDTSAVEEVAHWLKPPMCIKSTVIPGTTDRLVRDTGKNIVFSPEYVGETPYHKYSMTRSIQDLVAIGGDKSTGRMFLELYKLAYGAGPRYFLTDAVTAELSKYMENCFFATKVAFVAQFQSLAEQFGADFDQAREIWVADTRIGSSHSAVIGMPGFGGRCLPKDLQAIISAAPQGAPILEAVLKYNGDVRCNDLIAGVIPEAVHS